MLFHALCGLWGRKNDSYINGKDKDDAITTTLFCFMKLFKTVMSSFFLNISFKSFLFEGGEGAGGGGGGGGRVEPTESRYDVQEAGKNELSSPIRLPSSPTTYNLTD